MEVSIKDTGIGMSAHVLPTIFHAFEQGDGAAAREYGGTGLGLSVTKALVELHGGRIRVVSEEGVGTVFTFSVPVATEQDRVARGEARGAMEKMCVHRCVCWVGLCVRRACA